MLPLRLRRLRLHRFPRPPSGTRTESASRRNSRSVLLLHYGRPCGIGIDRSMHAVCAVLGQPPVEGAHDRCGVLSKSRRLLILHPQPAALAQQGLFDQPTFLKFALPPFLSPCPAQLSQKFTNPHPRTKPETATSATSSTSATTPATPVSYNTLPRSST